MTPPEKPPPRPAPKIIYPPSVPPELGASKPPQGYYARVRASIRAPVAARPKTAVGVLAVVAAAALTAALRAFGVEIHIPPELFESFR